MGGEGTQYAADKRGVKCSRGGLAADVSYGEGDASGSVVEKVEDVASDGAGGDEFGGDLGVFELRRARRHEAELNLTRHVEVALHALLFLVDALVEAGVGDADGDLRGESGEGSLVVLVVVVDASVLEVEDADDFALVDEGDGEFAAYLWVGFDVTWILADVGCEDGFA